MSTLETTLRNRRAPGAPIECANRNETGYGEQTQPARVSMLDGARGPLNGGALMRPAFVLGVGAR